MKKNAFTLVEVLIVVAILGLLAAVGVPAFLNSKQGADIKIKEMNVQSVEAAKDQWAIMNNKAPGTSVSFDDIKEYIGGGVEILDDLNVNGSSISLNSIGTKAAY